MNNLESLLVFLFIGLIAGWLAGLLVKGRGFGIFYDILIGIVGAQIGGWIFGVIGLSAYGFVGAVLMAFVGAVALLTIIKLVVNSSTAKSASVIVLLLACGSAAHAASTVTVDSNDKITIVKSGAPVPVAVIPVVVTTAVVTPVVITGDFEGRISEIDGSRNQIVVQCSDGIDRQVSVQPEMINHYRIGDYVQIHPTASVTLITIDENPREFEGEIIRVNIPKGRIVVLDTTGRERRVQLKRGMIANYKVDDYVRIRLGSNLKEAQTVKTVSDVRGLEGRIVSIDSTGSRIVIRDTEGKDSTVLVRQGQISRYRSGDHVRVYLLQNRDQVQVIRVI